jgi:hypothetical protein
MVVYNLTFTFLDSRRDDKRLWTEWYQAFPEFSLLLISSWIQFWSVSVVPRYLNFLSYYVFILSVKTDYTITVNKNIDKV